MKKRILSILLILCMLASTVAMFASCGKKGEINVSKKAVSIDLTEYELVFDSELGESAKQQINQFVDLVRAQTKDPMRAQQSTNEGEEIVSDTPAILIGDTGYKESNKAFKAIKKGGWTIQVIDNKIVILGSNPFLTHVALAYFTRNYANGATFNGASISVNKKVVQNGIGSVSVTNDAGEGRFALVYNSWTDDYDNGGSDNYSYAGDNNPTTGGADVDYTYEVVEEIRNLLAKNTGAKARTFMNKKDTTDADTEYEILVGNMQREDYYAEMQALTANDYGLTVKNGKVMLLAWNETTLPYAYALFKDMVVAYAQEDEEGNRSLALPEGFTMIETVKDPWMVEFPKPEAADLHLHGTLDVGNHSIEYIYTGDGVNEPNYMAYCEKLEAAGYALISDENYKPLNTQNIFRYYLNEETGSTLYVYYSPYEFAKEQGVKDALPSIRIIASTTEHQDLPDESILNPNQTWTKITETMVTSLTHDYSVGSWGLAYIITLEDGSFIIFDGGGQGSMDMAKKIWTTLNARYEMIFGEKPQDKDGKRIHIAAWVITHSHGDHYGAPTSFWATYSSNKTWEMDYLIGNYPSASAVNYVANSDILRMADIADYCQSNGFEFLKVHAGQKYYFANLEIEVLTTYEDLAPARIKNQNDTSTVLRFTSQATTDGKTPVGAPNTSIWLGDANNQQSRHLCAMYGDYLKSDMVQVGHHGNIGCETDLYDSIKAEVVWFPNSLGSFRSYVHVANRNSSWVNAVDYRLVHENPWTKYVFVSGGDGKNPQGERKIDLTLPFGEDGAPAYDAIYTVDLTAYEEIGTVTTYPLYYYSSTEINNVAASAYKPAHNWQ